jgi:hypothetical protein
MADRLAEPGRAGQSRKPIRETVISENGVRHSNRFLPVLKTGNAVRSPEWPLPRSGEREGLQRLLNGFVLSAQMDAGWRHWGYQVCN